MMVNFYDVYDIDGNIICEDKTASEVAKVLNIKQSYVSVACMNKSIVLKKYVIKLNRRIVGEGYKKIYEEWDKVTQELKSKHKGRLRRIKLVAKKDEIRNAI